MAKKDFYAQAYRSVVGKLRVNGAVMMSSVVQLKFEPSIGIIARDIDKLAGDIDSFREPLKRCVVDVVIPSILKNFASEGRPGWEPYSPNTVERRDNEGDPVGSLLNRTGTLITVMSTPEIWTINDNAAILLDIPGVAWYGKLHQGGFGGKGMAGRAKAHKGDMGKAFNSLQRDIKNSIKTGEPIKGFAAAIPARPFVMLQPEDEDGITEVFIKWVEEKIALNWGNK